MPLRQRALSWTQEQRSPVDRPAYLEQQVELSLRKLEVDRIDLIQLHRIDPEVPLADQLGAFVELKEQGKVGHIGVSEVSVEQLKAARAITEIVSEQNLYHLTNRQSQDVLDHATAEGIGFIPWFPMATGDLASPDSPVAAIAKELERHAGAGGPRLAAAEVAGHAADPGTKSVEHLTENMGAATHALSDDDMARLDALV